MMTASNICLGSVIACIINRRHMQKKRSLCDYFKFLERSQLSLEMRVINLFTRRQFKCVDPLTRALIIHSYTFANCYLGYFRVKYRNYFVGQVQSPSF